MKASEYLENVSKRLHCFIFPVTRENLKSFTDGFNLGYVLSHSELQFQDISDAWIEVIIARGWQVNARGVQKEMEKRGMSEHEILDELMQIEIHVWKLLEDKILRDNS